uniref:ZrgA family zinc uptake protein n=1 Tax=Ningiella ruwaisensis TaxID=2364274 RepID=UPI00109FCEEC|nr:DUF2796 domain-containing protein [Ningiella ruwaisensis]
MFKLVLLIALSVFSLKLLATNQHVHGQGKLLIAQDGQDWQLEFVIPMADLLGFEHVAETAQQKNSIDALIKKIENVSEVLSLSETCSLISVQHSLDDMHPSHEHASHDSYMHEHKHDHDHKHEDEHAHKDVSITYVYACESEVELINIKVFEWAKSLEKLNAQWITNQGQGSTMLTASSTTLRLGS